MSNAHQKWIAMEAQHDPTNYWRWVDASARHSR